MAAEYPQVTTDYLHVDAATIFLVQDPARFDVIVTDNLFGDILTDLAAAVTGGIGLAASGNINPSGAFPSMFEPVHGSAPDIAGQQIADPTATILSVALLLDHLGLSDEAARVEKAVLTDLAARTGARRTSEVGDAIAGWSVARAVLRSLRARAPLGRDVDSVRRRCEPDERSQSSSARLVGLCGSLNYLLLNENRRGDRVRAAGSATRLIAVRRRLRGGCPIVGIHLVHGRSCVRVERVDSRNTRMSDYRVPDMSDNSSHMLDRRSGSAAGSSRTLTR